MKNQSLLYAFFLLLFFSCEQDPVGPPDTACDGGTFFGDVILSTQQEVDEFGALCFTTIDGKLTIGLVNTNGGDPPTDISNLEALNALTEITNGLAIHKNADLQNLSGLENLTTINGEDGISIKNNDQLVSLEALQNISTPNILNQLIIASNSNLASLDGLQGLTNIGRVSLIWNPLTNLSGIQNLSQVQYLTIHGIAASDLEGLYPYDYLNSLTIWDNEFLTNLDGLESLSSFGSLKIIKNPSLTSEAIRDGLDNIEAIENFELSDNNIVQSLDVLNSQTNVMRLNVGNNNIVDFSSINANIASNLVYIAVNSADNLTSLSGLESVSGSLETVAINANESLSSIEGLNNITEIEYLTIQSNPQLSSLDGLENLISTNYLIIGSQVTPDSDFGNYQLTDFCALQNLFNNGSFNTVEIEFNAFNPTVQDIQDGNCSQ